MASTGIKLRKQSRSNDEIGGSSHHGHATPKTPLFATVELVSPRDLSNEHHHDHHHHQLTPGPTHVLPPGVEFRSESSMHRAEKKATSQLFRLFWNFVALWFILGLIRNSAYLPQHTELAAEAISRSKDLVLGDSDAKGFDTISTKESTVDWTRTALGPSIDQMMGEELVYRERQECLAQGGSSRSCPRVPITPHKVGLWVFHISSDTTANSMCTAAETLRESHPEQNFGNYLINIGGHEYHLPHLCANFTSYEVSSPNTAVTEQWNATEDLPEFIDYNFDGATEAFIMIGQVSFYPTLPMEVSFCLTVHQSVVGNVIVARRFIMRDYSNYGEEFQSQNVGLWMLLYLMMGCSYWWLISQSDTLKTIKDRVTYVALYFLGVSPFCLGITFPLWGSIVCQIPLPLFSLLRVCYRQTYHRASTSMSSRPPARVTYRGGVGALVKDLIVVIFPVGVFITCDIRNAFDPFVGCHLAFFWVVSILVDMVVERPHFIQNMSWNLVDTALIASAIWTLIGFRLYYNSMAKGGGGMISPSLQPSSAFVILAHGNSLAAPFSVVVFLIFIRGLRYLDVLPSIKVPWDTFVHSFSELVSYIIVFVAIIGAFAALFSLNFGGEVPSYSGLFTAFWSLFPDLVGDLDTVKSNGHNMDESRIGAMVVFCYGFTLMFFVTNILLSIVMTHYDRARDVAHGRFLSDGLLSKVSSILGRFLPREAVTGIIGVLGQKMPTEEETGQDAHHGDMGSSAAKKRPGGEGLSSEDRERLLRLEKAIELLLIGKGSRDDGPTEPIGERS